MKVITREGIKLPYVGKETFIELVKNGLEYSRKDRTFSLKNLENVESVKELLHRIIRDDVSFAQSCFICGDAFPCSSCSYKERCSTPDLPLYCICNKCRVKPNLYDIYIDRWNRAL